jgi:hypothetical protein
VTLVNGSTDPGIQAPMVWESRLCGRTTLRTTRNQGPLPRRPVIAALVWHDYPASLQAATALVNDLDLWFRVNGGPLQNTREGVCLRRPACELRSRGEVWLADLGFRIWIARDFRAEEGLVSTMHSEGTCASCPPWHKEPRPTYAARPLNTHSKAWSIRIGWAEVVVLYDAGRARHTSSLTLCSGVGL